MKQWGIMHVPHTKYTQLNPTNCIKIIDRREFSQGRQEKCRVGRVVDGKDQKICAQKALLRLSFRVKLRWAQSVVCIQLCRRDGERVEGAQHAGKAMDGVKRKPGLPRKLRARRSKKIAWIDTAS